MRPYNLQQRTLLEVDQLIPLREAQEYTVRLKENMKKSDTPLNPTSTSPAMTSP
jgi:hypothetical protein